MVDGSPVAAMAADGSPVVLGWIRESGRADTVLWGPGFAPLTADDEVFNQVFIDTSIGILARPNGADIEPAVLHGDVAPGRPELDPPPLPAGAGQAPGKVRG